MTIAPGTSTKVTINLPNAASATTGVLLSDGSVAYPGSGGSANVVIPGKAGAQLLTVIANRNAPTRYTYPLTLPAGARVTLTPQGGAHILAADGSLISVVSPAWAKDANGTAVPTRYETDGTNLTQIIDHTTTPHLQYPVIADPNLWQWALIGVITGAVSVAVALIPGAGPLVVTAAGACVGAGLASMFDGDSFWGAAMSCFRAASVSAIGRAVYTGILSVLARYGIRPGW